MLRAQNPSIHKWDAANILLDAFIHSTRTNTHLINLTLYFSTVLQFYTNSRNIYDNNEKILLLIH